MDDSQTKERVWCKEVKWPTQQNNSSDGGKIVELFLSDDRKVNLSIDNLGVLQDLIDKLENSIC